MDGPGIDQKIRFGYAKAAVKLGKTFQLYRSSSSIDPLNIANFIGNILMAPTQSWSWMTANRPGNAIWYVCIDGQDSSYPLEAIEGDFLVGEPNFFILSKQYQMPMQAVETNDVVSIYRPYQSTASGGQGYVGFLQDTSTLLMQGMPASILINGKGQFARTKLPTDSTDSDWIIMLPNLGDVILRTGDIMIDSSNENYIFQNTENTEFGWRCFAQKRVV